LTEAAVISHVGLEQQLKQPPILIRHLVKSKNRICPWYQWWI